MLGVVSPKRSASERHGLHAWHPYYAGFSEGFVADILSELRVGLDQIVLDPMNGSGTTTVVAQKCGYLAVGTELNPAMAIMARAKDGTFSGQKEIYEAALDVMRRARNRPAKGGLDEHITAWIPTSAFADLKRLEGQLAERQDAPIAPLDPRLVALVRKGNHPAGGRAKDLLLAALLVTARRVSKAENSKNPTWLKPGKHASGTKMPVFEEFKHVTASMLSDLKEVFVNKTEFRRLLVQESDARNLSLPDNSVDAIVTSPPYLTRIDYAVGTAPELVVLGYETAQHLRSLRGNIMGSTCVTGGSYSTRPSWGKTCLELIDRVRHHPSKASAGYYLKMHVQYFRDAEAVLRECLRVLKPGAPGIFVVQDSWYKDIHIALDKIYVEMATELGAQSAETIHSEAIRNHLGLVNTRARQYPKGAVHEHVVLFRGR